jgi:methylmalonyl-CoA mutase N-terminal domain/subunit
VEAATERLASGAQALLDGIEAKGGALAAIERGEIQRAIQESAYRFQRQVEAGERVVVGVNRFQQEDEAVPLETLRVDPELERAQCERVRALRARRDAKPWQAALGALEDRARGGGNLVPAIVDAVLAQATVGEVAGRLRGVFGEHRETLVV